MHRLEATSAVLQHILSACSLTKRKNKMNGDGRRYGGAGRQVETLGRVWLHINVKAELRWSADTAVAYPVRFKCLRTKSHGLCGNSLCGR